MAKAIGKQEANEVSSRLTNPNMSFDKAVEMLSVLGYEVVIQERRPGARRAERDWPEGGLKYVGDFDYSFPRFCANGASET